MRQEEQPGGGAPVERVEHALEAYRERRRRRRGEDTYFGSLDCLIGRAEEGLNPDEISSRRAEIMEEAEDVGMPLALAELLYDIARDEGLDPALGFDLVRCGLGVLPPAEGLSNAASEPTSDKYLPDWMFPPAPTDDVLRERMLRLSFRRLRSFLEREGDVRKALGTFAAEPDVGHFGY
jgi:hypothetical protein